MEPQVLLDKLSEFLMVEQAGAQLYRVAASRATRDALRSKYEEFGKETEHHRDVLIRLIEELGGDPSYISPTARVAQVRGESMLNLALCVDGLSEDEICAMDLESVLLAETKDQADWSFLAQLAPQIEDAKMRSAVERAVNEVEAEEDEHLEWSRDQLASMTMEMVQKGPAPSPDRWQLAWTGPHYTADMHPAPMTESDGLMEFAGMEPWDQPPVVRATGQKTGTRRRKR